MRIIRRKPKLKSSANARAVAGVTRKGVAAETHLRIMVEQMVREGRSADAIEAAVRRAA